MKITGIDSIAECKRSGLEYSAIEVPNLPQAERYYLRLDGGDFETLYNRTPNGAIAHEPLTTAKAYRLAVERLEAAGADCLELATAPNEGKIFLFDHTPKCKGAALRTVVVCPPPTLSELRTTAGRVISSSMRDMPQERIPFRTVERLIWRWGRLGSPLLPIFELAENGGRGEMIWAPPPAEIEVQCPAELLPDTIARDRYNAWATIAQELFAKEHESKLASEIDTEKLSRAAFAKYTKTFREAAQPDVVTRWSPEAQALWTQLLESLCCKGVYRHTAAPQQAIEAIARERAEQLFSDIVEGRAQL